MVRVSGKADNSALLKRFGTALRAYRNSKGFSQEALADASGIERAHMGRIERGERNLSLLNIDKIARALELTPGQLLALID